MWQNQRKSGSQGDLKALSDNFFTKQKTRNKTENKKQ